MSKDRILFTEGDWAVVAGSALGHIFVTHKCIEVASRINYFDKRRRQKCWGCEERAPEFIQHMYTFMKWAVH